MGYVHVEGRFPRRSEEAAEYPGAGVTAVVSCCYVMLGTELRSSVRAILYT